MVKTRKEKREYEEPADYDMSSEGQDEFNNEPPMLSRSDSRRGKKKTIFRYPLLNLLIVFFSINTNRYRDCICNSTKYGFIK